MFGDILRDLRLDYKLTQEELAAKLNITRAVLSKYELGVNEPDLNFLVKCSDFFEVSIDYLLGRTRIPTPQNSLQELSNYPDDSLKKLNAIILKFKSSKKYIDFVYSTLLAVQKLK